jgi:flotillin
MAEAMRKKAEAWQQYGEAAIVQTIAELLPQLAKNVAEPLSRIEKMVVINSGPGGGGASKITKDVADIVAQLPPIVEGLTGVDLAKMIQRLAEGKGDKPGLPGGGTPKA